MNKWQKNKSLDRSKGKNFIFTNNYPTPSLWKFMKHFDKSKKLKMMEIGCQEGRTSIFLTKNYLQHPKSQMYCLDMFPENKTGMEQNLDHNIKLLENPEKVVKMKGPSWKSLRSLNSDADYESFDLIYIDGWHGAHSVLDDALFSFKLLKLGGILVFDDYNWGKGLKEIRRPKIAIDTFAKIYAPFLQSQANNSNSNQKTFRKTVSNQDLYEKLSEFADTPY